MNTRTVSLALCTALALPWALAGCSKGSGSSSPPGDSQEKKPTPPHKTRVLLQIDSMVGTKPVQLVQQIQGAQVSLAEIYRQADVDLRIVTNPPSIQWQDTVRLADLHGMMTSATPVDAEPGELKVHMLVVSKDVERPGTLGIMFDFGVDDLNGIPRQGFAVFESAHNGLPTVPSLDQQGLLREVLLTTAHELTHVFNLHHSDWLGDSFESGSTVEGYSFTDTVKWSLSPASIAHFKGPSCPQSLVLPGANGLPFGLITEAHAKQHQQQPFDQYEIVPDNLGMLSRRADLATREMATRSSRTIHPGRDVTSTSPLKLALASAKTNYIIGEAPTLTAALTNTSDQPKEVVSLLSPEYRFLSIAIRGPGDQQFRTYMPPVLRDSRGTATRTLEAKASMVEEAKIFFGSGGWTFERPGEYVIEATYPAGPKASGEYITSAQLKVTVEAPKTAAASRAKTLLSENQKLGFQQGLYLYMGGGSHLEQAQENLQQLVKEVPAAEQAVDARIALAKEALAPTVDEKGDKPDARLEEARQLLQGAQVAIEVAPTTLLKTQGELIRQLERAGKTGAASAERAVVERELGRDNPLRALDRRDLERRL